MLNKKYSQDGKTCQVTFTLPAQVHARVAHLYGDFTEWEKFPKEMLLQEDGSFSITLLSTQDMTIAFAIYWMVLTGKMIGPRMLMSPILLAHRIQFSSYESFLIYSKRLTVFINS